MRQHKFKIGDKVKLNKLALQQNAYDERLNIFKDISESAIPGEVVHLEENLPDNSNFRYKVNFDGRSVIVNETQIDHVTG